MLSYKRIIVEKYIKGYSTRSIIISFLLPLTFINVCLVDFILENV